MKRITLVTRLPTVIVLAAISALMGCEDDPASPTGDPLQEPSGPVVLQSGVNAYLVVTGANEPVGSILSLEARIRSTDEDQTPTAFVASLYYDHSKLEFLESVDLGDGVLRFANPQAAPGMAKVAGAAANGLNTDRLFVARMRVLESGYLDGLRLELPELGILERGFADVASEVHVSPNVVTSDSMVVQQP